MSDDPTLPSAAAAVAAPAYHGVPPEHHHPLAAIHLPGQIEDAHGGDGGTGHMMMVTTGEGHHYEEGVMEEGHGHHHGGGMDGVDGGLDGELVPADEGGLAMMVPHEVGNQLTLSFHGQVYVFDSVSPEKVQAVLLLLGGRELTSALPSVPSSSQQNNKRSNFPQRVASLIRFREKRKERNYDKKIRYTVRKEVALRMQRNKGQFTSSKPKPEDASLGVTSWDSTQQWGTEDNRPQSASSCHHCGINSKATPMMRRGPDGPRTLCNACGLMWANKGALRDLSKNPPDQFPSLSSQLPALQPNDMVSLTQVTSESSDQNPVSENGHGFSMPTLEGDNVNVS